MMLYRNTKVNVRSADGDTDYFDIVAGVLQGDTLAPYHFIIWLGYVVRTSRDEFKSEIILWTPSHGQAKAGRPARTYIQQLCPDTGCSLEDLPGTMNDRDGWQERVREYVTYGFVPTSPAVFRMRVSSSLDSFRDATLCGAPSRTCLILLAAFLCNCCQSFSP